MNRSHLEFAVALHGSLPAGGGLVWSPYSVASAMGLVAAGARGPTREEIASALAPGFRPPAGAAPDPSSDDPSVAALADLGGMLRASAALTDAEAAVANTLWLQAGLELRAAYRQEALGWPGSGVRLADFRASQDGCRQEINADVEKTTRGLVRELLKPGSILPDTRLVVVNALYLKVAWSLPFPETATSLTEFHTPAGTRQVPTMRQRETMTYAEHDGWRMVTLPTTSEAIVDILLPPSPSRSASRSASPSLSRAPSADTLATLYRAGTSEIVDLTLPRFRVTGDFDLNTPLQAIGVDRAFDRDRADLSGILTERLYISLVQHQAVLRADEQGFEGAAATAVVVRAVSMITAEPVTFHVDRPFVVVVRHRDTGALYFLARVTDPSPGSG